MDDSFLSELVGQHPCLYDAKNKHYKDQNVRDNVWTEIAIKIGQSVEECKKRWKNIRDTYNRRKKGSKGSTGSARSKIPSKWYLAEAVSFLNKVEQERQCVTNIESKKETEETNINEIILKDEENDSTNEDETSVSVVEVEVEKEASNSLEISSQIKEKSELQQQTKKANLKFGNWPKRQKLTEKVLDVFAKNSEQRQKLLEKNLEKSLSEEHLVDIFFKSMAAAVKKMSYASQIKAKMETCRVIGQLELDELQRPSTSTHTPLDNIIEFSNSNDSDTI